MIPKTLSDYLVTCKGKELSYDLVVPELKKAGWQDDVIEEGRIWYGGTTAATVLPDVFPNIPVSTPASLVLPVFGAPPHAGLRASPMKSVFFFRDCRA